MLTQTPKPRQHNLIKSSLKNVCFAFLLHLNAILSYILDKKRQIVVLYWQNRLSPENRFLVQCHAIF
jgi:hypothetical protein